MALALYSSSALGFAAPIAARPQRAAAPVMETIGDLKALAPKLNPVVGYWNPLCLGEQSTGTTTNYDEAAAIGWLRHAEIKHGRVAMAAFVGFCVQSNTCFPWALTLEGIQHSDIAAAGGPCSQWDALPTMAKLQILGLIFLLELYGESSSALASMGEKHYVKGGKPGVYPSFQPLRDAGLGQPPLDLFDPFGLQKKMSPEKKEKGRLAEINNGRLAMLGIMAFVSEAKVPGAVPGLAGCNIARYSGEVMAPFAEADGAMLPFVKEMLAYPLPY